MIFSPMRSNNLPSIPTALADFFSAMIQVLWGVSLVSGHTILLVLSALTLWLLFVSTQKHRPGFAWLAVLRVVAIVLVFVLIGGESLLNRH